MDYSKDYTENSRRADNVKLSFTGEEKNVFVNFSFNPHFIVSNMNYKITALSKIKEIDTFNRITVIERSKTHRIKKTTIIQECQLNGVTFW